MLEVDVFLDNQTVENIKQSIKVIPKNALEEQSEKDQLQQII